MCLLRHLLQWLFWFVSAWPTLFPSVSMAAEVAPLPVAAVAAGEGEISTAALSASLGPVVSSALVAAPKARAEGGRGRGAKKPQIDIDDEIAEANKLAELFRKMQKASKVAARNAGRQRQRLVRKAQKLSEQDLMRLAVIKRCGMFVPDESVLSVSAAGADGGSPPAKKSKAQEHISSRFKTLATGVAGAAELCEALDMRTDVPSTSSARSKRTPLLFPKGKARPGPAIPVLQRLPSRPQQMIAAAAAAAATEEGDDEEHESEHESGTEDADEAIDEP